MREVLGRVVVLVAAVAVALLLTPATAVAQCTGGLVNTLGGPGSDGCGGIYPAVGSAVAVAVALGAIAVHAAVSFVRGAAGAEFGEPSPAASHPATAAAARTPEGRTTVGDPIDVATGDVVLHHVDVELPGVLPLVLSRTHVSSYRAGRSFGPTWSATVDQRLEFGGGGVVFISDEGAVLHYPDPRAGSPVLPEFGPRWPLRRTGTGYVVDKPEQAVHLEFALARDGSAPLAAIADRNGNRVALTRDERGTPRTARHSGGYLVEFESADGLVTGIRLRVASTSPVLVGYAYDGDRLVEVTDSSGRPLRFGHDTDGRITRWEDRNGHWYRFEYDDRGRCVLGRGTGGYLDTRLTYADRRTVCTDGRGATTTYDLNEHAQVVRVTDPVGAVTTSVWDRHDRLLSRTDPLGHTTSHTYDRQGDPVRVGYPDGSTATATYNALRLPVTVTDPDGASRRHDYDARGNLISVTDPDGATTRYGYRSGGRTASVTDPLGHTWLVETDAAGLPVAVTDPLGATTRYVRDPFGRVSRIVDPVGGTTRLRWTVEGRLLARTAPGGAVERWRYDPEGNQVEHVDAAGRVTSTEYTAFDQPSARTEPDGARYEFGYDSSLLLVSVTNPQGLVWRHDYDPAGRPRSETDFNGRTTTYGHDLAGRLVERTNGAGERTVFVRDALGQVVEKHAAGVVTTFGYDAMGRLVRATNPDADLTIRRDVLGRVLAETVDGRTLHSAYDLAGRRTRVTTPSGAVSRWEHDASGRPVALHTAGQTVRFDHDAAGREVRRTLGTGVTLTQAWDAGHRLTGQVLTGPDRGLLQRRGYEYRGDGHVTGVQDRVAATRRFDLDPAGRVVSVRGDGWTERYAYDSAGNVIAADWPQQGSDSQGDREYAGTVITRAGRTHYRHDPQGRMTLRRRRTLSGQVHTWHYSWDADDRLTGVVTPDGTRWSYRYDPLGRRLGKRRLTSAGAVVEQVDFTWDGVVLAEQHRHGAVTTWTWRPGRFEPLTQTERTASRDERQAWVDERFHAIVTDLVGTPTELVGPGGDLAWRHRTSTWGGALTTTSGDADCPLRFPGQYLDEETGQHYNQFRYYDPEIARYTSADPIGLAGGYAPHSYVPNPLTWLDPLGLALLAVSKNGVRIVVHEYDVDWPAHAHVTGGGGREVRIGPNGHPIDGQPELTRTQRQVVSHFGTEVRKAVRKLGRRNQAEERAQQEQRAARNPKCGG